MAILDRLPLKMTKLSTEELLKIRAALDIDDDDGANLDDLIDDELSARYHDHLVSIGKAETY